MSRSGRPETYPFIPKEGEIPLGSKIRVFRWYRDKTIRDISKALESYGKARSESYISDIERNKEIPSYNTLLNLAEVLDTTPRYLDEAPRELVMEWLEIGSLNKGRRGGRYKLRNTILAEEVPSTIPNILTFRISGEFELRTALGNVSLRIIEAEIKGEKDTVEKIVKQFSQTKEKLP